MHILVHDYAGHAFPVQLSRCLASRGHRVTHVFSGSTHAPRGPLEPRPSDPPGLDIRGIHLPERIEKYSFVKRRRQEISYARLLVEEVRRLAPDVVISSNTPLDVQFRLHAICRRQGIGFVFWLQDSFGQGIRRVLRARLPLLGAPIAAYYEWLEKKLLSRSDQVVLITDDFLPLVDWQRTSRHCVHVLPNWAPLEEIPVGPRDNPWARANGLADKFSFVYTGTLGLKHNPDLLLRLALRFREDERVRIVVISEGRGADWLAEAVKAHSLRNLVLLPYQPFEALPHVLASADVLVAILEPDAGIYSVPSKVLTYLCASRPLLLGVPTENLAARIVREIDAGRLVEPTDAEGFVEAAVRLLEAHAERAEMAANGRRYAEKHFEIEAITSRFEEMLQPRRPGEHPASSGFVPVEAGAAR